MVCLLWLCHTRRTSPTSKHSLVVQMWDLPDELEHLYSYTGCPKSSFLYFISLYFSTIGLGKQIISTKVVSFNIIHYFHTCCAIFWLEYSICVLPRQRCACASIFSSLLFWYFIARIGRTPSLIFVNIKKRETHLTQIVQLRESISICTSIYWLMCYRNC